MTSAAALSPPVTSSVPPLIGGGAMGQRIRDTDWSATPLGDYATWPQSLRSALSLVLNAKGIAALYWGPDQWLLYNDAYGEALGDRHPWAFSRRMPEVLADIAPVLSPQVAEVLRTGEGFAIENLPLAMHRHGRHEDTVWTYSFSPVQGETGGFAGVLLLATEMTRQKKAERELLASETRHRDLLQQMPGFVGVLTGPNHICEYVNDALVAISGPRQFIGRSIRDVFPDIEGQGFFELLDHVYATGEPYAAKGVPFRLADEATDRFTDFMYQPIRTDDGEITGVFIGGYEVTEQHRTAIALRELNANLERRVVERSHEMRRTWQVSTDLLCIANDQGFFTRTNPAWQKTLGWDEEETARTPLLDLVHPDDVPATVTEFQRLQAGDPVLRYENRYRTKDGDYRWLAWVAVPEDGVFYCSARDVTDSKAQAATLALRTQERDRMWETSPDLMLVIDFEGTFRRVNPAWTTVLGYSAEELVGHHVNEFVISDDHHETTEAYELAAEGGRPRIENRYRHKDGSVRWISWVAAPTGDMTYATGRDITAGKEQAEILRRSQVRASTYFNFSEDYLFLAQVSAVGGVTFGDMNPACERIMGLQRADVIDRPVADFVPSNSAQDITKFARDCLETRQPQTYLAAREYQDGQKTIIEGRVTFVERLSDGGGLVLFSGRDVTEQRLVEDALRQSQKMEAVGQLTGGVAHDFNNLLTVIKSSTDLLKRPDLAEERRTRYVAAISDTVERAAKLTGQLLAFARRQALKPEVFAASDSVQGLADMMRTLTGSRVQITVELPETPCYVNADASQFDTALVNMAVNARDAMDGEGRIAIKVQPVEAIPPIRAHPAVPGPYVAVSLSDTGSGIPAEMVERIFEPFFTTKETGKGTGLGLSQVFGFAKQSGGEVTVDSAVGEGTTFTLYLPRVPAPERAKATEEPDALVDGQGTRVLVVEDNIDVGTFAVQSLSDLGYTTVLAADGTAALAELAKHADRFDVVFSDVMMPGMSGIELGQEIRRLYHDLPVVLTSGYSHVLAQNGTYGFELLHKPYSVEQLSQMLRKAASWQRRRRLLGQ